MGTRLVSILLFPCLAVAYSVDDRPRIISDNGQLVFMTAENRNISFISGKSATIKVNGEDLVGFAHKVKDVSDTLQRLELTELPDIRRIHQSLQATLAAPNSELVARLENVEMSLQNISAEANSQDDRRNLTRRLTRLTRTVNAALNQMQQIQQTLETNECSSSPCRNGGTCIDGFGGYQCLCPDSWEGSNCEVDVNECANFAGTGLGCQNGATCINQPGTYRCICPNGWFGIHCTSQSEACSGANGRELCGRGVCVSQPGTARGYSCICEQGWKSGSDNPSCIIDVDECQSPRPPCSVSPLVQCMNTPGSYMCGPCPQGYTGNGHYCVDIDECQINNGGCSQMPRVQCINTIGSRQCGSCPVGYEGDGINCRFVGACSVNNGGCHPLATCMDNPAISTSYVYCHCRPGFTGSGMGPMGCMPLGGGGGDSGGSYNPGGGAVAPIDPCASNPCATTGTCLARGPTYACLCAPGFTGQRCDVQMNLCESNPCQNGGTCSSNGAVYACVCPRGFTGYNCETQLETCGGYITDVEGTISFPTNEGELYPHLVSCAWVVRTTPGKILNVTFSRFSIEGPDRGPCRFDWLQVHDGDSSSDLMIGRFCGQTLPLGGNFLSTHNTLYIWFRSDHAAAGNGFQVSWTTIDPVCGGLLPEAEYGAINSPGYPGQYPHDRDCYWIVSVPPGKRIQFTFATLQLEHHNNCSYDFLEVRDGADEHSPILGKFCSTGNPPPLITSGRNALVHFHSDDSQSSYGFHITYSSMAAIPGCGGLLTSPEGSLSSPNHPDTYDHNVFCEWIIRAPPGERLQLSFSEMHLEQSSTCRFDYVEIRDGGAADSPSLGRYCGRNLPPTIRSSSNLLYVKFRTDHSVAHGGFRGRYQTICGGEFTSESGFIKSPFYPSAYPANRECDYVIALQPGKAVSLTFQDFAVERSATCLFDYVEVRDGDDSNSTLIGRYCGGPDRIPPPVISTHNYLWLRFKTDRSDQDRGFFANYSSIDIACGGILTNSTGVIASPLHPQEYPHGVTCRWIVRGPPGSIIRLTFQTFSLESSTNCNFDHVEVYDNTSVSMGSGRIGRFCGQIIPPVLTTVDNVMTVIFKADSSIAAEGFTASYSILNQTHACGGDFYTTFGIIKSPGYPANYPASRDCVWTVYYRYGYQLTLTVLDFNLEDHDRCNYDYVEIRNGKYASSPLIGRYCGTNIPSVINTHGNQVYLRFVSDSSRSGHGFRMTWEAQATGCGGTITSPSGSFASPSYPHGPRRSVTCTWTITVSAGSKAQLAFSDLDMGESQLGSSCMYDYVEVRDGSHSRSKLIGKFCGVTPPLTAIVASGRSLYVKYVSRGSSIAGRGFMARYDTYCNVEIRGLSGVIESPNFPYPYPHGKNCTWDIIAPLGNKINMTFSHFDVETSILSEACLHDYVEVRDGKGSNQTVIGHFCGPKIPAPVSSRSDQLQVRFESDFNVAGGGFRLEWEIYGCGGLLTKDTGLIRTPNYPDMYPVALDCVWQIQVEHGSRVEVTVEDFDIEGSVNCEFDYLKIISGRLNEGIEITSLCNHRVTPPIIATSSDSDMVVHFHSDGSVRGRGFKASYKTVSGGCGGVYTAPFGTIHSPNYPQNYDHGANCGWKITVAPNHVVELRFSDFDVEPGANCTFDYVAVYDGPSDEYPTLIQHCGETAPNQSVIRSTSNEMFVRLVTDSSITSRGFMANYTTGCGARIITSSQGEITSPGFPQFFGLGMNCSWIIQGAEATDRVTLTFTHLELRGLENCTLDYVQVREGDSEDSPLIGSYCMTKIPTPIVSEGQSLFVHLVTDRGVGAGFRATYSVVSGACGGNLSAEHGVFASPNYPDSYPPMAECVWTIQASPGNRVLVSFRQLNIEESEFCNNDYVEIRENDGSGHLIGHYCGSNIPTNITAAQRLWIKFRSDEEGTASGFVADYSLLHGNELFGNSGEIASPLYPIRFTQHADYTWRIVADQGLRVAIFLSDMRIEKHGVDDSCQCALLIYDGYDESATLLSTLCGYVAPRQPIIASSNVVFIKFISIPLHEGSEFKLRWEAWSDYQMAQRTPRDRCGGDIYVSESNITAFNTPGFPNGYAHNLFCMWTVLAPPHMRVQLQLVTVNIEDSARCNYDRLEVRQHGRSPQRFCKRDEEGQIITSVSNRLRLFFYSDSSVNRTGVNMTVTAVCGGLLTEQRGLIESPRYPQNYPSGASCEWVVRVRPGRTIEVVFEDMATGGSSECNRDYVVLRNGDSVDSPFLGVGKYCGNALPQTLETASNQLHVKFVSDATSRGFKGFRLRYKEKSLACGGQVFLTNGIEEAQISSPNHPNPSSPNAECEWNVVSPAGTSIQVDFLDPFDFVRDFRCYQSGVEIRDGASPRANLLGSFCESKPGTVFSSTNAMYIKFYVRSNPRSGFAARVSIARCGGTVAGNRGVITSPKFPGAYDPNSNCSWHVNGPDGHSLNFYFTAMDLPAGLNCSTRDFVEIAEVNTTETAGVFCGQTIPTTEIRTGGSNALVRFVSGNRAESRTGFRLVYNASVESCGGELNSPEGRIQSPGYPNSYPSRSFCVWRIRVPPGRKVKLEFEDFSLQEKFGRSCRDSVAVSNGSMVSPIYYLCGNTLPEVIRSSRNYMRVVFRSDSTTNARGFTARYSSDEPADCGALLEGNEGYITSPGFANGSFPPLVDCEWAFGPSNTSVTTVFTLVTEEIDNQTAPNFCYGRNTLVIDVGNEVLLDVYVSCYTRTSPWIAYSPFPEATIHFGSGLNSFRGFNVTYKRYPCGGVFKENANISSPDYPNNYPLAIDCVWLFDFEDSGALAQLTFANLFDVGSGSDCSSAYVSIRNGHSSESPEIGRYCNTNLPPTDHSIVAGSSYLRVHFHAAADVPKKGFSASVSARSNGCGGILHGISGEIETPSYPNRYPHNTECMWQLQTEPGFHFTVNFTERFDLENSTNCQNDFIEIAELDQEDVTTSAVRYCGKKNPGLVTTRGNVAKVTFRSNSQINANGFKISWKRDCGGVFNGTSGTFMSPGFPDGYKNNLLCNFLINASSESYVLLTFEDPFELEDESACAYDRVSVYSGTTNSGRRVGRYCGNRKPTYIVSTKGPMLVEFYADGSRTGQGFIATYSIEECGGIITEPTIIKSPAHPNPYLHNLNCTWRIQAPTNQVPEIKFEKLELEVSPGCRFDYIGVYEGAISNASLIGKYCGIFNATPPRIKTRDPVMTVNLITDATISRGGFVAAISFTYGENHGCGGKKNVTSTGSFEVRSLDIDGNGQYEPGLDCRWVLSGEPGQVLRLQFSLFDIEESVNGTCHYDYVEVRDGMGPSTSLLGRYCGTSTPPALVASSNFMFLRFVTDMSRNRRGFVASLTNQPPICGSALPLIATNQTQELTSPNYPNQYGQNLRCRYVISTGDNIVSKIDVQFVDMDLENDCSKDRLEIEDIPSEILFGNRTIQDLVVPGEGARRIQIGPHQAILQGEVGQRLSFCGSVKPHDVFSTGGSLAVTFITDNAGSGKGFKLRYSLATCNRTYYGPQGRIVSSVWPLFIPALERCQMTIQSEPNTTISLYFNYIALKSSRNCSQSAFTVFDGSSAEAPLLSAVCGRGAPPPVFSSSNRLYIDFRNTDVPVRGYDVTYVATSAGRGCGGTIFNSVGSFTSPDFPRPYNVTSDCSWEVSVPLGYVVGFGFTAFQVLPVNDDGSCASDYVEITSYDPVTGAQEPRGQFCGSNQPADYLGMTNAVIVRSVTSTNSTGTGWRVFFRAATLGEPTAPSKP